MPLTPGAAKNDPRWIVARYAGVCSNPSCSLKITPGMRVVYWPIGKKLECHNCGDRSYERFTAAVADEGVYEGRWAA
jgi:hypothetical protein